MLHDHGLHAFVTCSGGAIERLEKARARLRKVEGEADQFRANRYSEIKREKLNLIKSTYKTLEELENYKNESIRFGHQRAVQQVRQQVFQQVLKGARGALNSSLNKELHLRDGIARIYGLDEVMAGELVECEEGTIGIALNLESNNVGVVLMGDGLRIQEGSSVKATGKIAYSAWSLVTVDFPDHAKWQFPIDSKLETTNLTVKRLSILQDRRDKENCLLKFSNSNPKNYKFGPFD
ncbi:hypothetical protein JRO89_XS12G0077500 [Xanthoceras sorbifolium]|uniref:ATPase F1/V1/A1 complex alpha/beta subunit N-terminal domain-containing protein n=1 Tax=Xanthoceras sorbifolium TaxID=99658 RepID=A0ABQ8HBR0_9ROSI|nr:hypothetical protein JRO89_XS12G0077500 [Xanthoceras sorbifolium]